MAVDYEGIGKRIKYYRLSKGLSQEELGQAVNVNNEHLSRIETGTKYPSLELLIMVANALEVSADDLLIDSLEHTSSSIGRELHTMLSACNHDEMEMLTRTLQFLKALFTEFGI